MALEFVGGTGPFQSNTDEPYRAGSSGKLSDLGITITTVGGLDYFRWTGTATTGVHPILHDDTEITFDKTFKWGCLESYRLQGVFGSVGDEVELFRLGKFDFYAICQTDTSHYVVRVKESGTTVGTSSTEFAVGTTFHASRIESDGTNVTLHIDAVEEFRVASSVELDSPTYLAFVVDDDLQDGQTFEAHNFQFTQSNDRSDRPDHQDMTGGSITLTGDKVSATYGSDSDCEDTSGTYTKWNDWETGDADDATTHNCELGGASGKEISDMSDPSVTNLIGIQVWLRSRASIVAKTVATTIVVRDTVGHERIVAQGNLGSDTFITTSWAAFGRGPNITGWTSAVLNDTGVGVQSPSSNTANDEHTALMVEWFGVANDPPGQPTQHRTQGIPTGSGTRDRPGRWN